jgi:UDP-glucose 4-epimerase
MLDKSQQPTVIISGANGYFGGIACQFFVTQGWRVLKAMRQPNADLFFDLDAPEAFAAQKPTEPADLFIHAAAAHEITCREQPYRSIAQNVVGTKAALDFCVANGIKYFTYLSTFHVFGDPKGTIDEYTHPLPANDYGLSHLQAEEYVQLYTRQQLIKGLTVRPSNFFGAPVDLATCNRWTLVPLAFCREALRDKQITLQTPGDQQRNFVDIVDICQVIRRAYTLSPEISVLHIPGPDTLSIRELATLVQTIINIHLQEKIEVTIPEGSSNSQAFNYSSAHLSEIYVPNQRIKDFILDLCNKLKLGQCR